MIDNTTVISENKRFVEGMVSVEVYYQETYPNVFGKNILYRIAVESNIRMMGFISFP